MMRAGLRVRMDRHGAGPDFLRADPRCVDRGGAVHARRLRSIAIELVAPDDFHAVLAPIDRRVRMLGTVMRVFVILAHGVSSSARLLRRRAQCRPAILHGQKTLAWPHRANGAGGRKKARSQGAGFWSPDEAMMRSDDAN